MGRLVSLTNAYITLDTTDSAERVLVSKQLEVPDSIKIAFGDADDITMAWDGTDFDILQATTNSSIKLGISGAGIDVVFYGDTATRNMTWDQSADTLLFNDNAKITIGTGSDVVIAWDATDLDITAAADDSVIKFGTGTNSFDLWFYGNAAGTYWSWDASADSMKFEDNCFLGFGTNTAGPGTKGDINITWNATKLLIAQTTVNSAIDLGVSGAGIDLQMYGDTVAADLLWDQSADSLILGDAAKLVFGTGSDLTISWDATSLKITQVATDSAIQLGVSGAGIDLLMFGDTVGANVTWDQSADKLLFGDGAKISLGTSDDIVIAWDGTDLDVTQATADSSIKWGVSGAGIDHVFYGDTATRNMTWDQSADALLFEDSAKLVLGTGSDIVMAWDGTDMDVTQATANSSIKWGIDGAGIDHVNYGDTASAAMTWDQSDDSLVFTGVAKAKFQTIVAADAAAIPVTHSGSFPITQNGAETNTLADPTYIGQWLNIFVDTDTSGARVITAASRINQAANNTITLTEVGDFIKLEAITIAGALKWQVVANDGAALSTV